MQFNFERLRLAGESEEILTKRIKFAVWCTRTVQRMADVSLAVDRVLTDYRRLNASFQA